MQKIAMKFPQVVSDIVMKLLAKNAEDRYQTAEGIKADLEKCLNYLQTTGEIVDFVPGEWDRSGQLSIPQKLYGREAEVDRLLAAFERVSGIEEAPPPENAENIAAGSQSEIVLVSGYSGLAKPRLLMKFTSQLSDSAAILLRANLTNLSVTFLMQL
jgi:serine/threonine protein kinase